MYCRICIAVLAIAVAFAVANGCGGNSRQQVETGQIGNGEGTALGNEGLLPGNGDFPAEAGTVTGLRGNQPAFPGGSSEVFSPVRMVSEEGFQTDGDGFVSQFGANNRAGANAGEYVLIPEEGDIAWAMYSIPELTGDRPVRVEINVTPAELEPGRGENLQLSYWIGVANYTMYRWDWFGPFTEAQALQVNSHKLRDRYVDKVGTLHWVAVLYNEAEILSGVTIQNGTVVVDPGYYANKPHYAAIDTIELGYGGSGGGKGASDLDPSQFVTVNWSHVPAFSFDDEQNEAFQYRIYRQGPLDESPQYVSDMFPAMTIYIDPYDNGEGIDPVVPGASYRYYVRAGNLPGFTPLSVPKEITIPILTPKSLSASDGTYTDRVTLNWTGMGSLDGYNIYRDSMETEIATVGEVTTWDDLTLAEDDYQQHTYWVTSFTEYVESNFSNGDPGDKNAIPVADLQATPTSGDSPLTVSFNASGSLDLDGSIVDIRWDFDGDGIFNELGSESSARGFSTAEYTYADGTFQPAVRVTDNRGTDSEPATVEIVAG